MRRIKQLLAEEVTKEILGKCTNGVLSVVDSDGEPYGVPLSFAYDGDKCIYFHSAVKGHKIDCIANSQKCSFCVVEQDRIVPEEFTTYFRSVIASGSVSLISDPDEIMKGLLLLCDKYSPGVDPAAELEKFGKHVAVLRLDVERMTGKESIELVRERAARHD